MKTEEIAIRPLCEVIKRGHQIRVYLQDSAHEGTTSYTQAVATGEFTPDGYPIVLASNDTDRDLFDLYLPESKVKFRDPKNIKITTRFFVKQGYTNNQIKSKKQ